MSGTGNHKRAVVMALCLLAVSMGASQAIAKSKAEAAADSDDAALEARVRALEQKVDTQQKGAAAETATVKDRVLGLETSLKETQATITEKLGVSIHGFVAGSYLYNFNTPNSRGNTLRTFDTDANTFSLDYANLNISRKTDEGLGFVTNLDFGKAAEVVGSVSHWSNSNTTEQTNSFELREAYLTYKLSESLDGVTFKAGRFVTLLGAEIIDNFDNHNFNVSRSISFGYGIPFTHTGLLANIPMGSIAALDLGVVNGWDNVVDNNSGKTGIAGLSLNPTDIVSMYFSAAYGPEQTDNGHSKRAALTGVVTVKPTDILTIAAEGTYGNESDLVGAAGDKSAEWYGGALYGVVKATDALSIALRGEVFDDTDGTRFANTQAPNGSTAWEITPTLAYQVTDGLLVRAEYRHDEANQKLFQHNGEFVRGQDTIATQAVYSF